MTKLIECFRVERLYKNGMDIMCECPSCDNAQKALIFYASGDADGVMYHITKYFKVVDDEE